MKESGYQRDHGEYLDKLRLLPGFDELPEDKLHEVLSLTTVRQYEPGETIIHEGESGSRVFFLVQGLVRVVKGDMELGRIRRLGDVFGEMGVIDGCPRSAMVQAIQRTLCLAVDASVLDALSGESKLLFRAVLYKAFAERLAARVRDMNRENVQLKELLLKNQIPLP